MGRGSRWAEPSVAESGAEREKVSNGAQWSFLGGVSSFSLTYVGAAGESLAAVGAAVRLFARVGALVLAAVTDPLEALAAVHAVEPAVVHRGGGGRRRRSRCDCDGHLLLILRESPRERRGLFDGGLDGRERRRRRDDGLGDQRRMWAVRLRHDRTRPRDRGRLRRRGRRQRHHPRQGCFCQGGDHFRSWVGRRGGRDGAEAAVGRNSRTGPRGGRLLGSGRRCRGWCCGRVGRVGLRIQRFGNGDPFFLINKLVSRGGPEGRVSWRRVGRGRVGRAGTGTV